MDERDFSIGEKQFKLNKIDALRQFHIVRRMSPILGEIIPIAQKLKHVDSGKLSEEQQFDQIAKMIAPIMNGISKLTDADAQLVLLGLCSSVEIHQPEHNNWARISTPDAFRFDNLSLPVLLQAAARAFMFNLSDFFALAPQVSHGGK